MAENRHRLRRFVRVGAFAVLGTAALLGLLASSSRTHCAFKHSLMAAQQLETATELYLLTTGHCPEPHQLLASSYLHDRIRLVDRGLTVFRLSCPPDGPVVTSAGPDRRFGTSDDLSAANPRAWSYE